MDDDEVLALVASVVIYYILVWGGGVGVWGCEIYAYNFEGLKSFYVVAPVKCFFLILIIDSKWLTNNQ